MNAYTLATLESRLRKVEKQNRILIAALVLGVSLIACTSATLRSDPSRTPVDELRAKRIVLVDSNDKEIGIWSLTRDGLPQLVMGDNKASWAVTLGQEKDRAFLNLKSPSANKLELTAKNDTSSLLLPGSDSTGRGYISLSGNAAPSINFTNANKGSLVFTPGSGMPICCKRSGGATDWSFTGSELNLNGIKLKLNKADGTPIKELP